jgi:NAD(P)-dependent dehydrogenase (short-subunit alcohol dehydrogenase family)
MSSLHHGTVALVVGGGSGIGLAAAQRLESDGATVVVADLNADHARSSCVSLGVDALCERVDVTDERLVELLIDKVIARHGRLDAVVNTAGINRVAAAVDQDTVDFSAVIDVCLTGAFHVIKHASRRLVDGGAIVTVSSLNAIQPAAGMSAYCAAKAGVLMLTQVAALELGDRGIRVNAVSPGLVDTPLVAPIFAIPQLAQQFMDNTPLGRVGTPEDIAACIEFLVRPGGWTSGENINVNGGAHLRRYPELLSLLDG